MWICVRGGWVWIQSGTAPTSSMAMNLCYTVKISSSLAVPLLSRLGRNLSDVVVFFFLFLFIHCRPNLNPNSYKGLFGFGESVFRSSKERHLKKPKWWIIQKTQIINVLLVFLICFILEGERQFVAVVSSNCIKWMVIFYKQAKHSRDGTPGTGKTTTNSLVAEGTELRWRRRRRECNWVWVVFLVFVKKPLCFDLFLWQKKKGQLSFTTM